MVEVFFLMRNRGCKRGRGLIFLRAAKGRGVEVFYCGTHLPVFFESCEGVVDFFFFFRTRISECERGRGLSFPRAAKGRGLRYLFGTRINISQPPLPVRLSKLLSNTFFESCERVVDFFFRTRIPGCERGRGLSLPRAAKGRGLRFLFGTRIKISQPPPSQ